MFKRSEETIKFFFEHCVKGEGLMPDFSLKELCDLHKRAMDGDYTSQLLMIEIYERLMPQLDQEIISQIRKEGD
tara:strand:+ start:545 stop:766 length:222 start_codon:yes stop_codon:yes gene_type:complete